MKNTLSNILTILIQVLSALCLVYAFFGAGLCACTTPQATQFIGSTFSGWQHAVYPENDMAAIAEEVRSFSVDESDVEALYETVNTAMNENYPILSEAFQTGEVASSLRSKLVAETGSENLAILQERYSFEQDAISHLQDCTPVFTTMKISTGIVFCAGIIGLVITGIRSGRKAVGQLLMASGLILIMCLIVLAAWALIDFNSLFTLMHSLLFTEGSWVFSYDSLLISLFPEAFWAAMAGLWTISSITLSLIAILIGKIIKFRA